MRERDAKRNADLSRSAQFNAGMPVGLVEIPELSHLLLERVGGQHPVFVLDHVPDFERQPLERDRRGVPVLPRLLLPLGPDLTVPLADRGFALIDARRELRVAADPRLADAG